MFLGDSFTDGVSIDDRDTAVNRYGHVARKRGQVEACPVNTGVDGYGTLEESFVLELRSSGGSTASPWWWRRIRPWRASRGIPSTRANYQEVLRRFCEREGIRFIDLLNSLSAHDVREIYLDGDPHWNAKGHEVVAEILYEQTKDLLAASILASQPRPDRRTP